MYRTSQKGWVLKTDYCTKLTFTDILIVQWPCIQALPHTELLQQVARHTHLDSNILQ